MRSQRLIAVAMSTSEFAFAAINFLNDFACVCERDACLSIFCLCLFSISFLIHSKWLVGAVILVLADVVGAPLGIAIFLRRKSWKIGRSTAFAERWGVLYEGYGERLWTCNISAEEPALI